MEDKVGRLLLRWRIYKVLPHIRGKLLDIGCGTNELVRMYTGQAFGVDVYQWGSVDIVVEDSAKLPFSNQDFDTITILAALNHIPNRKAVLQEAYRLLKPGGRIIVTMIPPATSKVWHRLREPWDVDQSVRGMQEGEVFGLSHSAVVRLFREAGFSIELRKRFMFGINCLTVGEKSND